MVDFNIKSFIIIGFFFFKDERYLNLKSFIIISWGWTNWLAKFAYQAHTFIFIKIKFLPKKGTPLKNNQKNILLIFQQKVVYNLSSFVFSTEQSSAIKPNKPIPSLHVSTKTFYRESHSAVELPSHVFAFRSHQP